MRTYPGDIISFERYSKCKTQWGLVQPVLPRRRLSHQRAGAQIHLHHRTPRRGGQIQELGRGRVSLVLLRRGAGDDVRLVLCRQGSEGERELVLLRVQRHAFRGHDLRADLDADGDEGGEGKGDVLGTRHVWVATGEPTIYGADDDVSSARYGRMAGEQQKASNGEFEGAGRLPEERSSQDCSSCSTLRTCSACIRLARCVT